MAHTYYSRRAVVRDVLDACVYVYVYVYVCVCVCVLMCLCAHGFQVCTYVCVSHI